MAMCTTTVACWVSTLPEVKYKFSGLQGLLTQHAELQTLLNCDVAERKFLLRK